MTQPSISRLNYDATLGVEDRETQQEVVEQEIVTRTKLASGFPYQQVMLGIVDASNPAQITSSETGRPLFVKISTQNSLSVAVNPGYAVSQNATVLNVPAFIELVTLSGNPQEGDIYVVCVEALAATGGSTQVNDYQIPLNSQIVVSTRINVIEYEAGWEPEEHQVALAAVKVVNTTGIGLNLVIDQTQTIYPFLRPWFSVVDISHRAGLGSGTVTTKNVHALSINDLTLPGTVGLFQGMTGQGVVVSQARLRNKMIGALICNDQIAFANIKTDTSGSETVGSVYNRAGALYAELTKFPVRLGSVYDSTSPSKAIAADVIPETNRIVFGPFENFNAGQTINVQYSSAAALRPPTVINSNLLTFTQPEQGEAIVSGGFNYATIADPTFSFEGYGPFARRYQVHLMATGQLQAFPQILVPPQSVFSAITGTFTPTFPARISVGITNTTGSTSLSVTVTLTGVAVSETDSTTGTQTETLTFTPASGYMDQIVPSANYDLAGQILRTVNRYSSVTAMSVSATNAGPNPQIQVWAEIENGSSPELNETAPVTEVLWNGNAVNAVRDARRIQGVWGPAPSSLGAVGDLDVDAIRYFNAIKPGVAALTDASHKIFTEDFEDLKHFDSLWGFYAPTSATGVIGLNSAVSLLPGDTITLYSGKTLTGVTGTPVTPGQFDVGSPLVPIPIGTIVQNLIDAINLTAFDSKVVAEQSTANVLNINVTLTTPTGVAANSLVITATTANVGAVALTGFNFAADGYGECYLDRNIVGLNSKVIPSNGNLNPYQATWRGRYRSRAMSLASTVGAQTRFFVQLHDQNKSFAESVRIRGSLLTNPKVWEAWALMTPVAAGSKGLYQITFANPMHKVQVEFYGRARGLTLFLGRP